MDSDTTIVVFRKYPDGGILALFPAENADASGLHCTCYEHVGQHGSADYYHCLAATRPATPDEYAALQRELESEPYKYRFKVQKRYARKR